MDKTKANMLGHSVFPPSTYSDVVSVKFNFVYRTADVRVMEGQSPDMDSVIRAVTSIVSDTRYISVYSGDYIDAVFVLNTDTGKWEYRAHQSGEQSAKFMAAHVAFIDDLRDEIFGIDDDLFAELRHVSENYGRRSPHQ